MEAKLQKSLTECEKLIPFLKVVSNTTRLKILCILRVEERKVGDIQKLLGAKQSYISQQLKYLKTRKYLDSRREGTQIYYRLIDMKLPQILKALYDFLD